MMRRPRERGFTYLAIILTVALMGIGMAAVAEVWTTASRRDKEKELLQAGHELRSAIGHYYDLSAGGVRRYPPGLDDLLKDNRFPGIKRHLRRIPIDPMTNARTWGLIAAPGGGIMGVYSLSEVQPLKIDAFGPGEAAFVGKKKYLEWRFVYIPSSNPNVRQALPVLPRATLSAAAPR